MTVPPPSAITPTYPPLAHIHRDAGPSNARLSPILAKHPDVPPADKPQFAELLTPAKLRKKRRHEPHVVVPPGMPTLRIGTHDGGFYTVEGDFFRGASRDPTVPIMSRLDEDALTIGGSSSTSSSSSWSWGSGNLERGRRVTKAVFERVGEALGVRRGSGSSGSSDTGSDRRSQGSGKRRLSRRLSRSVSRATVDSSPDRPKREHLPRRREFVLLLPATEAYPSASITSTPRVFVSSRLESPTGGSRAAALPVSERVIATPSLPDVLDRIRRLRLAAGYASETPPHTPGTNEGTSLRKVGSAPGYRRPAMPRGATSFIAPPVPGRLPLGQRTQSRLQALRQAEIPVRPKSVSDLIGLATPGSHVDLSKTSSPAGLPSLASLHKGKGKAKDCWWLDVSCPGWEDLRDIGELLALHPLTLEDVLQQDPREKLDLFEKLGYYFVVVRALDEEYFKYTPGSAQQLVSGINHPRASASASPDLSAQIAKEDRRGGWGMGRAIGRSAKKTGEKVEIMEDNPGQEGLEGVGVGALNVYMVVFEDGIVSFHFDDISKHTKRVLERILTQAGGDHSSDWVAHGLIDSIVDAFFPLTRYVDGEIDEIDSLTTDPRSELKAAAPALANSADSKHSDSTEGDEIEMKPLTYLLLEEPRMPARRRISSFRKLHSRFQVPVPKRSRPRISLPHFRLHFPRPFAYLRLFFLPTSSAVKRKHNKIAEQPFDPSTMLRRIAEMRKLVTGLSRLLGAKHQVIGRLRKRAAETSRGVEAYIGDVEDHILLLQTSLSHYEYILAHCQPAYMSHLHVSFSFARGGTDQAILALSTVAISVLPMQVVIGLFSMNVSIPHNGALTAPHQEDDGSISPFNYFAGVVVGIFLIACVMLYVIRYWRWNARRKFGKKQGEELPEWWDGFWGWR